MTWDLNFRLSENWDEEIITRSDGSIYVQKIANMEGEI